MSMGPWTQAAKSLVNAAFGNPEMRAEIAKNGREAELFGARTDAARASANADNLQAKLREQELNALNRYSVDYANLFKPVEERAFALPEGVEGPQGPMMQRPPGLPDFQERLPNFLQTSIQAGASPADLGKLLQGIEGSFQSQGVTDFDERQRAIAFGAGNPFSTDELDAQNRANLPQGLQDSLASAVPSDQVFGGALLNQLDPSELVTQYRSDKAPTSFQEFDRAQQNPSYNEYLSQKNAGDNFSVTSPDGTVISYGKGGGSPGFGKTGSNQIDEALLNMDAQLQRINTIEESFDPKYLTIGNRAQNFFAGAAEKVFGQGSLTPEMEQGLKDYTRFATNTVTNTNATIKEITGAALSNGEAGRIMNQLPNVGTGFTDFDAPSRFEEKMATVYDYIKASRARLLDLKRRGITTFTDEIAAANPLEDYLGAGAPTPAQDPRAANANAVARQIDRTGGYNPNGTPPAQATQSASTVQVMEDAQGNRAEVEIDGAGNVVRVVRELQ